MCTHQEGDGVRIVLVLVERWKGKEPCGSSHALNTLREAVLHSLDQNRRNRLISRTNSNPVHLHIVSILISLVKAHQHTCVSKFGSSLNKHPNLPSLECNTVAPTMFLPLGSTPVTIPHLKPLTTFCTNSESIVLFLLIRPKMLWCSRGAPPICFQRLKKSSALSSAPSMYLCRRTGSWRVRPCKAPAR